MGSKGKYCYVSFMNKLTNYEKHQNIDQSAKLCFVPEFQYIYVFNVFVVSIYVKIYDEP